jgi:hypothetical protein
MAEGIRAHGQRATAVDLALDRLSTAFDHLLEVVEDGGLDGYDEAGLIGFLQEFERLRNRLPLVDHRAIHESEARGLAAAVGEPSVRRLLVHLLRLSPSEASRRVSSAEACGDRVSMLGEVLAPVRPHLAAAQRDGVVSPDQVQIIQHSLAKVEMPGLDPVAVEKGERLLTDFAGSFGTKDLRHLAEQIVDAIDPDGTLPDDQLQQDRRHVTLRKCRDGMYAGEFRLTGAVGAKLSAILQPLARPRLDTVVSAEASRGYEVDHRTFGQRSHDALEELCDRILAAGAVTGMGGTPATVIVTVAYDDLRDRLGYGTTSDGTLIPVPQLLQLAREAEIIPAVMSSTGAVLTLGRTRRIASTGQTHALIARDRGCSFPGCDRPPEGCERHHVREWIDGGPTDLNNLTLLCRYHHHNFSSRGWTCRINAGGLPEWRPPRWLDPDQKPMVNSRIAAHLEEWRGRRARARPSVAARRSPVDAGVP